MMKYVVGNWKMNGTRAAIAEVGAIASGLRHLQFARGKAVLCLPTTLLWGARDMEGPLRLGAQDCSASAQCGARTGEVAASMLADLGVEYCIVGHSERRNFEKESNETVRSKAEAAMAAGIVPIICVGETLEERESGKAGEAVLTMLRESVPSQAGEVIIAYEPVWAIGTGKAATATDIADMLAILNGALPDPVPLLYGGAVNPRNVRELSDIDNLSGVLVGGASLSAADFLRIVSSFGNEEASLQAG